jgi:hypothetical protein
MFNSLEIHRTHQTFGLHSFGIVASRGANLGKGFSMDIGISSVFIPEQFSKIRYFRTWILPVFLRMEWEVSEQLNPRPFLYASIAHPISFKTELRKAKPIMFSTGIGSQLYLARQALRFRIGYSYSKSRYMYRYQLQRGLSDWYRNHGLEVALGLRF